MALVGKGVERHPKCEVAQIRNSVILLCQGHTLRGSVGKELRAISKLR